VGFFCSLLAPSDAILFQEGVSVKLRLPQTSENVYHLPTIAFPLPVVRAAFCIRLPSDFTSGILRFR
ncbi:hypothetical protein, partial [Escherichia coli]